MNKEEKDELRMKTLPCAFLRRHPDNEYGLPEKISMENGEKMVKPVFERTPLLVRHTAKKTVYLNANTGKSSTNLLDVVKEDELYQEIEVKNKRNLLGVKIMYDESLDKVAFIYCYLNAYGITNNPSIRKWEEIARAYVSFDAENRGYILRNSVKYLAYNKEHGLYEYNMTPECDFYKMKFTTVNLFHLEKKMILIDSPKLDKDGVSWDWNDALKIFRDRVGSIVPIAGNTMVSLDNLNNWMAFMAYKQPKGKSGKKQDKLNELLELELPEVEVPDEIELEKIGKSAYFRNMFYQEECKNMKKYAEVQRLEGYKELMCVFRTFFKKEDTGECLEGGRIYIGKKDIIPSRRMENGQFIYQTLLDSPIHWNFYIKDISKETVQGTMLEYYSEAMKEVDPSLRGVMVWSFLKWPIIERMYKTDVFKPFIKMVFSRAIVSSPMEIIHFCLGGVDTNAKNVYQAVGMSKEQAELLIKTIIENMIPMSRYGYFVGYGIPKTVKDVLLSEDENAFSCWFYRKKSIEFVDISSIDINTVKVVLDGIMDCCGDKNLLKTHNLFEEDYGYEINKVRDQYSDISEISRALFETRKTWGINTMKKMIPYLTAIKDQQIVEEFTGYMGKTYYNHRQCLQVFIDYARMVAQLGDMMMRPEFNTPRQLKAMHDLASEIFNTRKSEIKKENWRKRAASADWGKWEYESGDYMVIAPKKPEDIAEEGIRLHHCVKSYIDRVASGVTNIMFIRRKTDPQTPFFTVEVGNRGTIEQVHGLQNCNAETVPGLPEFVMEWAKARHLNQTNYNKVR